MLSPDAASPHCPAAVCAFPVCHQFCIKKQCVTQPGSYWGAREGQWDAASPSVPPARERSSHGSRKGTTRGAAGHGGHRPPGFCPAHRHPGQVSAKTQDKQEKKIGIMLGLCPDSLWVANSRANPGTRLLQHGRVTRAPTQSHPRPHAGDAEHTPEPLLAGFGPIFPPRIPSLGLGSSGSATVPQSTPASPRVND